MKILLKIDGTSVLREIADGGLGDPLPEVGSGDDARPVEAALVGWAGRYDKAVIAGAEPALRDIGAEMFAWLDQGGGLKAWLEAGDRDLEIVVTPGQTGALADALLAAPWEVLCRDRTFLAEERPRFAVARRCVAQGEVREPDHRDLSLMFMAAAPEGDDNLDYEREEASILAATTPKGDRGALAHVQVEESGALEFLDERLTYDGPFEALHISCHGNITRDEDKRPLPVLLLENAEGEADQVDPDQLMDGITHVPPLVFLSACRTAERGADANRPRRDGHRDHGLMEGMAPDGDQRRDAGRVEPAPDLADPYVRQLASKVPNVLGWDGSVFDGDATAFAEGFYGALSKGDTVPIAAAKARKAVMQLRNEDPRLGRHWHLARVYLGPGGGGAVCDPQKRARKAPPRGETAFLDKDAKLVPVARPSEFVGRRRAIQRVIRSYRTGSRGVVVHGMGNLGKSSLAARVAGRMRRHKTVAVFGVATERTIFQALVRAGKQIAANMDFDAGEALIANIGKREQVLADNPARFSDMVQSLLDQCFDDHPLLLVLDDFEQSLETPREGVPTVVPAPAFGPAVAALLHAFAEADTQSRLLVTTRYDFEVPDGSGNDLAARLARVPLAPMKERERIKQVRAKARADEQEAVVDASRELVGRALAAAHGNPGLQDALTRPILAGQVEEAEAAIRTIEAFHASGEVPPADEDVGDFFQRMAFGTYSGALGLAEQRVLGAATLFSEGLPVPRAALAAAATGRAIADPAPAIDRLLALGLLDGFGHMAGWPGIDPVPHLAANPLARPLPATLGAGLEDAERPALASTALPALVTAWQDDEGDFPYDPRGLEAAVLALQAEPVDAALLNSTTTAAVIYLWNLQQDARATLKLGRAALERLEALDSNPGPVLAGKLVNAAERLGEVEVQEQLLEATLRREDLSDLDRGQFLGMRADREMQRGDIAAAEASLNAALEHLTRAGDERQIAINKGKIADILEMRGDLDDALRIREQEELPVYEALGDRSSIAVTKGQIADILFQRGDLDGALRIREQEELPVYEALGDRRSIAVTKGQIADILEMRGDLDGALRIREQEQLPAFEALGDRRSIAVTKGKIADILQMRGDLDGALALFEERIKIADDMGDRRGAAVTKGKIADILQMRGDLDGALRIREQEQLPAFEALGDRREIAVTKGKIADILYRRGDLDGALALIKERIKIADDMGDRRGAAAAKGRIADILQMRGDLDGALALQRNDVLPIVETLGDRQAIAVTKGKIADILFQRGDLDGALAMHQDRLATAREMGDIDSVAHIQFNCAQIRLERGDHESGGIQTIYEELAEAFAAALRIQRPDFIGPIGNLLGQILSMARKHDEAVHALTASAEAFRTVGQEDQAAEVMKLIEMIRWMQE